MQSDAAAPRRSSKEIASDIQQINEAKKAGQLSEGAFRAAQNALLAELAEAGGRGASAVAVPAVLPAASAAPLSAQDTLGLGSARDQRPFADIHATQAAMLLCALSLLLAEAVAPAGLLEGGPPLLMRCMAVLMMVLALRQLQLALSLPATPVDRIIAPDSRLAFALLERARRVSAPAAASISVAGIVVGVFAHQFYKGMVEQRDLQGAFQGAHRFADVSDAPAYALLPLIVLATAGLFAAYSYQRGRGGHESPSPTAKLQVNPSTPQADAEAGTETKECPQCAEHVLSRARICRYCRYTFVGPSD